MRIAFAMINCNRRDGSARAVNEVAERLARRGHDVHLFARKAEDIDLSLITLNKIPGPGWPEVVDFWSYHLSVNSLLRKSSFDIVHSIGPNTALANVATIQNIQPAKARILERQSRYERISPFRRFTRWLYLYSTSAAERQLYTDRPGHTPPLFLPVSRGVENELRQYYQIGNAKVRIIPNAADTNIFHPIEQTRRATWRSANGFTQQDVLCIFSGGEWSRKGLELAITGVGKCKNSSIKLFVAGDDPDRRRFEMLAHEIGAADRIRFGGFRSDMATVMASGDIFLFPSYYEAFSLATIEAAACGLPIVASKINGTEDFIRPGETGEFIPHDPFEISRILEDLAGNDETRLRLGINARFLVEREYTWDRVADLTESAYRERLAGR